FLKLCRKLTVSSRPKKFTLRSKTATPRSVSLPCTAPCSHWLISAPLMHCTPRPARFYTATANPRRTTITWYALSAGAPKKSMVVRLKRGPGRSLTPTVSSSLATTPKSLVFVPNAGKIPNKQFSKVGNLVYKKYGCAQRASGGLFRQREDQEGK